MMSLESEERRRNDPYQEFEVYLEKAQAEIGQVFEELNLDDTKVVKLNKQASSGDDVADKQPVPECYRQNDSCRIKVAPLRMRQKTTCNGESGVQKLTHLEEILHEMSTPPPVRRKPFFKIGTSPPTTPTLCPEATSPKPNCIDDTNNNNVVKDSSLGISSTRDLQEKTPEAPLAEKNGALSKVDYLDSPLSEANGSGETERANSLSPRTSEGDAETVLNAHLSLSIVKRVSNKTNGAEERQTTMPCVSPHDQGRPSLIGDSVNGSGCTSRRFASCLRQSYTDVDMNALSMWAEGLVREMDAIMDDDDDVSAVEGSPLVKWLLSDLNHQDPQDRRLKPNQGCGTVPKTDLSTPTPMGNCLKRELRQTWNERCFLLPCGKSERDNDEISPELKVPFLDGERRSPTPSKAAADAADSDSESEVYMDALDFPVASTPATLVTEKQKVKEVEGVQVKIDAPINIQVSFTQGLAESNTFATQVSADPRSYAAELVNSDPRPCGELPKTTDALLLQDSFDSPKAIREQQAPEKPNSVCEIIDRETEQTLRELCSQIAGLSSIKSPPKDTHREKDDTYKPREESPPLNLGDCPPKATLDKPYLLCDRPSEGLFVVSVDIPDTFNNSSSTGVIAEVSPMMQDNKVSIEVRKGDMNVISTTHCTGYGGTPNNREDRETDRSVQLNHQSKPADLHDFLRRVETSIRSSADSPTRTEINLRISPERESMKLRSINDCIASMNCDAATQTTPPALSRSSSFTWLSEYDSTYEQETPRRSKNIATSKESIISFSGSSIEAMSGGSSSSSCASSRESDLRLNIPTSSGNNSSLSLSESLNNLSANASEVETLPDTVDCKVFPLPYNDLWVRRENVDTQTSPLCTLAITEPKSEESSLSEDTAYHSEMTGTKSASEISTMKSTKSSSSTGDRKAFSCLNGDRSAVRETHSDSNIAEFKIRMSIENTRTVKSEKVLSGFPADKSYTVPSTKLRPLLLRNLNSVSAPTSAINSPQSEELPSPPVALPSHLATSIPTLEMSSKSSSAPVLDRRRNFANNNGSTHGDKESTQQNGCCNIKMIPPPRSQSVKELTELEAVEACKWLRAAGFPQYAQMFEDLQFPIDIASVQKDHYFLDPDSIQSLFRRLNALNKCARMRLDSIPRKTGIDDSDEEDQCALSENWTYQRSSRRWSRIPSTLETGTPPVTRNENFTSSSPKRRSALQLDSDSNDSVFVDIVGYNSGTKDKKKMESEISDSPIPMEEDGSGGSTSVGSLEKSEDLPTSDTPKETTFRRTGSERLKDGARALLRRMESLKSRRSKRHNREAVVISGPQVMDVEDMQRRMQKLACVDLTPPGSSTPSPRLTHQRSASDGPSVQLDDSSSLNSTSDNSLTSNPTPLLQSRRWHLQHSPTNRPDLDSGALSDSECSPPLWHSRKKFTNNETKLIEHYLHSNSSHKRIFNGYVELGRGNHINFRTGSFNLGNESSSYRDKFIERQKQKNNISLLSSSSIDSDNRISLYDNVPTVIYNRAYSEDLSSPKIKHSEKYSNSNKDDKAALQLRLFQDSNPSLGKLCDDVFQGSEVFEGSEGNLNVYNREKCDSTLTRENNTNHQLQQKWQSLRKSTLQSVSARAIPINCLSAGQLMVLRKLALLKLTALMERYSPSSRSGWSWVMPKFIKRMKVPDYKDKAVFGVPLIVVQQRTGQPLPASIQSAMRFLKKNAIDSVGLFRKSGVRSRIQKLKNLNEANPDNVSYEGQQTYDVADMLKQYFRELPEALLTNKMSETFITIYQFIPEELRLEALQSAILLMPDENREVLQKLLSFLVEVSQQAHENQMTASNLAVCFAPSLFHMNMPRSSSTSPRRRKTVGVPDQKELNENRAAHECLTQMIKEFKLLFSISEDIMMQCRFSFTEDSYPVSMDDIGYNQSNGGSRNWQSYINLSIQNLFKEIKEKGWVSVSSSDNTDLSFKKVGDGNPLRLWKVSVEVEAPPVELLSRVLRERHLWDHQLVKWRVITRLDNQSEIYQYMCNSMSPLPTRDYCVLRSWRTELPKGSCVLVETSVDHPEALVLLGDVRALILTSRYLIEPCGSGKSRITQICRVDTRGRSPEWHNKAYGHLCALYMARIRDSFRHNADGPESKV